MISITISKWLVERYTRTIPFQARICPTSGPIFLCGCFCYSVDGSLTSRHRSSHGVDEEDIFLQINFQDLAAEFSNKKHESFTTLTFHHAQCRLTILRFLVSCRGM